MRWFVIFAIVIAIIGVSFVKRATNNVCKTFEDYYSDRDKNENCYHNPDHELTVPDIIRRYGYPVETHLVTTEDGYILTIFRIPHGKNSFSKKPGKPVFLQHGFASNCACFVNRKEKSLGFILADEDYDVWLGNFRGSTYSRNHIHLTDFDRSYWNFSFHEHGIYDLPAQLQYVSDVTDEKITYIGFSMGTLSMYIYGVTYPEVAKEKIKIFINLAPSAFLEEHKSFLGYIFSSWFIIEPIVQAVTNGNLFARISLPKILKYICYPYPVQLQLCQIPEMLAFGYNYGHHDPETLPIHFLQNADWAPVKGVTHFAQLALSSNFQNYDYGTKINKLVYGSSEPPHYNLTQMRIPTYFIRAKNDLIITKENVERLYRSLPKETKPYDIYVIDDEYFNHLDFLTSKNVVPLLYNHIVEFMRRL